MNVTTEFLDGRLIERGFRSAAGTADHSVYVGHGDRVLVPRHSCVLSPWTARAIEWSLEPRLGAGWLTAASDPSGTGHAPTDPAPPPSPLHLVIRHGSGHPAWDAFVVEEPRIVTFGRTLAETRRRALDAMTAWFGRPPTVEPAVQVQVDETTQRWIDLAAGAGPSAAPHRDAAENLSRLGFSDGDIGELLGAAGRRSENAATG